MLNNPISQIERTQDAFAGNPKGLENRANMSKELIDLLAMQKMQADMAAAKRNMAMQQQSNSTTINDQMKEGLLGQYREEAAKDLGVGPSESDVVARAGIASQPPQGAPQAPQGAPQAPQGNPMGGGLQSQSQPVKLAGGGIVAFYDGGPISDITDEDVAAYRVANPEVGNQPSQVIKNKIYAEAQGTSGIIPDIAQGLQNFELNPIDLRPGGYAERIAKEETEKTRPKYPPKLDSFAPTNEQVQKREELKKKAIIDKALEAKETAAATQASGIASITPPVTPNAPNAPKPYEADAALRKFAQDKLSANPEDKGLAAIDRIKDLSDLSGNRDLLEEQQRQVEASYKAATPSKFNRLAELFTAGGTGGITGTGRRGAELRGEDNERRRKLDSDIGAIRTATISINQTFGKDAASAYAQSEALAIQQQQNAATWLQTADKAEVDSVFELASLASTKENNEATNRIASERNNILSEQIRSGNLEVARKGVAEETLRIQDRSVVIRDAIKVDKRFRPLTDGSLDILDDDDAEEIKKLEGLLSAAVNQALKDEGLDEQKKANALLLESIDERTTAQQNRLDGGNSFGADADAAINSAGK